MVDVTTRRSAYRPVHTRNRFTEFLWILVPIAVVAVLLGAGAAFSASNQQTMVCTVTDKDRTKASEGKSDMRIYTKDCGTLSVGDVWWKGHFASADTYSSIEPGNRYQFKTVGYRIPIFSQFPTIVEVDER